MITELLAIIIIVAVFFFGRLVSSWVPDEPEEGSQLMAFFRDASVVSAAALLGTYGLLLLLSLVVFRHHYVRTLPFIALVTIVASSISPVLYGQTIILSLLVLASFLQGVLSFGDFTKKVPKKT